MDADIKLGIAPEYKIMINELNYDGFQHKVCLDCEFTCHKIKMRKTFDLEVLPPDCTDAMTAKPFEPLTIPYNNAGTEIEVS